MQTTKIIIHIVDWLNAYGDAANMNGYVVGVSGGIDSAVTSTLCAKTANEVIVLNMPIYQAPEQSSLAAQHIKWLKHNYKKIDYRVHNKKLSKNIMLTDPQPTQHPHRVFKLSIIHK